MSVPVLKASVFHLCRKEHEDAKETAHWVEEAGRKALLLPGELEEEAQCQ